MFNNFLLKSGEYSHARSCAPLLIYYLLNGIRVNISHLIIDFMLSEHLLILSRYLHFGKILTRLFKHPKIDLSGERVIAPFVDINSTLLKRMQAGARVHAPSPPVQPQAPFVSGSSSSSVDPYAAPMT